MKLLNYLAVSIILITLSSCDKMLLEPETENNPVAVFDNLWNNYDKYYGGFIVKNIDWDTLYDTYRPLVNEQSSDEELYNALTGLLDNLNDNHVILWPTNPNLESYTSGVLGKLKTFSDYKESTVNSNYLISDKSLSKTLSYGKLSNNLGYIHFTDFNEGTKFYKKSLEEIIGSFENTDGIIIDIRNNEGGTDLEAVYVAGHFTSEEKLAFTFQLRDGPNHDDFNAPTSYYVKPEGKKRFTKNVVVLTHRFTISAAETFTLAMDRLDNVTIVGDTTSGAFSDVIRRDLPNGWVYGISVGDWRDFEGKSYEGTGFPPDILIENDSTDVINGIDKALEKAIDILKK